MGVAVATPEQLQAYLDSVAAAEVSGLFVALMAACMGVAEVVAPAAMGGCMRGSCSAWDAVSMRVHLTISPRQLPLHPILADTSCRPVPSHSRLLSLWLWRGLWGWGLPAHPISPGCAG